MFCVQRRNSRWPPKVAGKHYLRKVTSRFWSCPAGQKFRRNRSISLCYLDKHIFAFNAEIQDGRQKSVGKTTFAKSPVDSADTLWVKNFVEIPVSQSIIEINMFLRLTQKFKMAAKSGGKIIFAKSCQ